MSEGEGGGEKNQRATPKKLDDQRKKGQVAQSQDFPKLLILLVISEMALDLSASSLARLQTLVLLPLGHLEMPFPAALDLVLNGAFGILAYFLLVTIATAMLMRAFGSWLQFGFLFAPEAVKPDIKKLNPVTNFKEKFSGKAFMDLLLNVLKAIFISLVVYAVLSPALGTLILLVTADLQQFWLGLIALFRQVLYFTFAVLIVLSVGDLGIQKFFFARKMRMSHEDLKKESKETQGKPEVKQAQRERSMELLNQPPANDARIEDADMLVVNPTHVAVALYYRPEETALPKLLIKGGDAEARDLIAQAHRHQIPVLQCIRLARAIYPTDVGSYIPRETLRGVAQLYGMLRQLDASLEGDVIEVPDSVFSP
ncbi:type III secretion system export apparatus subunit SctU [Salinicola avicenniae]|uniref:type III secretion system export apparatus subunit SctU n=1 Tax=Salinicola avicenniae TaxID=2916836 RepID=UPI002073D240|nr:MULTISPECIES: type III secretion system export apparatus subunit SctU [unclassified Salinicola]